MTSILDKLNHQRRVRDELQNSRTNRAERIFAPVVEVLEELRCNGVRFPANGKGNVGIPEFSDRRPRTLAVLALSPDHQLWLGAYLGDEEKRPVDTQTAPHIALGLKTGTAKPEWKTFPVGCEEDLIDELAAIVAKYEVQAE